MFQIDDKNTIITKVDNSSMLILIHLSIFNFDQIDGTVNSKGKRYYKMIFPKRTFPKVMQSYN